MSPPLTHAGHYGEERGEASINHAGRAAERKDAATKALAGKASPDVLDSSGNAIANESIQSADEVAAAKRRVQRGN